MDDQEQQNLPSDDSAASADVSQMEQPEAQASASSAVSTAKAVDLSAYDQKIADAQARAERLEKQLRELQSAKDREIAETRKQTKERLARERENLAKLLEANGVDANNLRAYQDGAKHEDELEELREKAARADALEQQRKADEYKAQYVKQACEDAGIDPTDARLDQSSPEAFERSLRKALKEDLAKAKTAPKSEDATPEKKNAPKTVSPLSGVAAGSPNKESELRKLLDNMPTDPGELTKWHKKVAQLSDEV